MRIQIAIDDGIRIEFRKDVDGWYMTINGETMLECLSREEVNDIALAGMIPVFKEIKNAVGEEELKRRGCSGILEYV